MKKLIMMFSLIAATGSLMAVDNASAKLNPMVLIELQASMKGDLVYAERMMALDIEDDLEAQSNELIKESTLFAATPIAERLVIKSKDWLIATE